MSFSGHAIAERLVDSISPEATGFERDELVVRAVADALLLDSASYSWFGSSLQVFPRLHDKARSFCMGVVLLLIKAGAVEPNVETLMINMDQSHGLSPAAKTLEVLSVAASMERDALGLDDASFFLDP